MSWLIYDDETRERERERKGMFKVPPMIVSNTSHNDHNVIIRQPKLLIRCAVSYLKCFVMNRNNNNNG